VRRPPPLLYLAIGWLLVLGYAYPGVLAYDSLDQLREARARFYTDGHPPAMAALWSMVERICAGPFGMLAIQTAAFLGGLYLVLRRALRPIAAAIAAVVVTLFPPVLAPLAVVWKDAIMAGLLMLGIGCVLDHRRAIRIAGLGLLLLATAMRYNALAAALPIVVLGFEWPVSGWLARYAIAIAAWLAITAAAVSLNSALVDRRMHYWHSSIAVMDIVGTLAHVDRDLPDDELRGELAGTGILVDRDIHAAIRERYVPYSFEALVVDGNRLWILPLHRGDPEIPEAKRDAIGRAWRSIVFGHPFAYASHRLTTFGAVLGLSSIGNANLVVLHHAQDRRRLAELGLPSEYSPAQDWLEGRVLQIARRTPLFHPFVYLAVAVCLLAMCRRHRDIAAILLSGIALEATLVFVAPTTDLRYSHWMIACTCAAIAMLIARRYGRVDRVSSTP
jgi:hypothetical protein